MLVNDFITDEHEAYLLNLIYSEPFDVNSLSRRTKQYGFQYDYSNINSINMCDDIPDFLSLIVNKINTYFNKKFNQVIINEYQPGQGIADHIDNTVLFGDTIISLSLGSGIIMKLGDSDIYLPRRSLLILKEEFRYLHKHGIKKRKSDMINGIKIQRGTRVSITFREIKI